MIVPRLTAVSARFDHLVIAVPDLDAAVQRWQQAGLPVVAGGRHPSGTTNALLRGPADGYVELISAGPDAAGGWTDEVRAAEGPMTFAIAVDDLEESRSALMAAGFRPGEIRNGARRTPDGDELAWRMCGSEGDAFTRPMPFLIQWLTPMPPGPADGPVVSGLSWNAEDPDALASLLRVLGFVDQRFGNFSEVETVTGPAAREPTSIGVLDLHGELPQSWMEQLRRTPGVPMVSHAQEDEPPEPPSGASLSLTVADPHADRELLQQVLDGVAIDRFPDVRALPGYELLTEVERRFAHLDVARWPDPLPGGHPTEDEDAYSRVTDEQRYRIVPERARTWLAVLADHGLAEVTEADASSVWRPDPEGYPIPTRADVVRPTAADALPIVVGYGDDFPAALLGVGLPAEQIELVPDCGCDACDWGSDDLLVQVDEFFLHVLAGDFVRVRTSTGTVTSTVDGWGASGDVAGDPAALIDEVRGRGGGPSTLHGAGWLG